MSVNINFSPKDIKSVLAWFGKRNLKTRALFLSVILFILFILALGIRGIAWLFGNTINYAPQSIGENTSGNMQIQGNYNNINTPPPLKLSYEIIKQTQESDGKYKTTFHVTVHKPVGNFQSEFPIYNRDLEAKCFEQYENSTISETNSAIGSSSTTISFKVDCVSEKPVTDTGKLFLLK